MKIKLRFKRIHVLGIAVLLLGGCVPANTPIPPTQTLLAYQRDFLYQELELGEEQYAMTSDSLEIVVTTTVPPDEVWEEITLNSTETLQAFTACEYHCHLYVEDLATSDIYEIRGPFLEWRYFTRLQWLNDEIIAFDHPANPNHINHYEINFRTGELVYQSILRPLD